MGTDVRTLHESIIIKVGKAFMLLSGNLQQDIQVKGYACLTTQSLKISVTIQ